MLMDGERVKLTYGQPTIALPTLTEDQRAQYDRFEVQWQKIGEITWRSAEVPSSSSTITLPVHLEPSTFSIRVRAIGPDGIVMPFTMPWMFSVPVVGKLAFPILEQVYLIALGFHIDLSVKPISFSSDEEQHSSSLQIKLWLKEGRWTRQLLRTSSLWNGIIRQQAKWKCSVCLVN